MDHGGIWTDIYISRLEKRIREVYTEAEADIDEKMKEFTRKYKVKEAKYAKQVEEGKITQEDFDRWKKGQVFQGKQWEIKKNQIIGVISNANSIATKISNSARGNVFIENSNYQAYLLECGAGVNFGFGLYDSSSISRMIEHWDTVVLPMYKIDEPKDYIWNSRAVNNSIMQGIIQGERLDQIANRLTNGLCARNRNKMLTFARTGMTQAQNAGRLDRLNEATKMGIKVHKEWMATLDERTRTAHQILDGQKVPIDKPFRAEGYTIDYPGDPYAHPSMVYNCRCTLVGDLDDYPAEYERYDNINGKPISNMTYQQWKDEKNGVVRPEFTQVGIGRCKTVKEINNLLNSNGLFRDSGKWEMVQDPKTMKWKKVWVKKEADLTGCDLESAKSIASSYEQMFKRYPALKGRFSPPNAQPVGMSENTYAWCHSSDGRVEVNPNRYKDWISLVRQYEEDVISGWHPRGTTAESIITHELGHAIDYLLADEGILGGFTKSGEFRTASSSLKTTIMNRAAKVDPNVADYFNIWGSKEGMSYAVNDLVSQYATKNNKEWFAECFAEYITSANPRTVATEFGKELERLISKLN